MSGFSADWLALREANDWRARSPLVTEIVAKQISRDRVVRAGDLAAGAGSNMRFLARRLPQPQEWRLLDHDAGLLERARQNADIAIETRVVDLSHVDELRELVSGRDLVTASALLDLVSEEWLRAVCSMCHRQRSLVLFALSYDGRMTCAPQDQEDELVRRLVNRHQRMDKSFGRALGPDASARARDILEGLGYNVVRDRSDWVLDRESNELQRQLIEGWAAAATEIAPGDTEPIAGWRVRRLEHVRAGESSVTVGHEDLGAFIA
ncbi:MAG TPA: class I SAM-dependent methyltransferase [Vicinamibacterales bacterium]